jgi:hypothetical protein
VAKRRLDAERCPEKTEQGVDGAVARPVQTVENPIPVVPVLSQTDLPEIAEAAGDARLRQAEQGLGLASTKFANQQQIENPKPVGLRQSLQVTLEASHIRSMILRA